ncbi:hypothetical protein HI914_02969 [Erysiphe necator]|nr:hypothetical protein HI914_02969 [Erysiphe necator]
MAQSALLIGAGSPTKLSGCPPALFKHQIDNLEFFMTSSTDRRIHQNCIPPLEYEPKCHQDCAPSNGKITSPWLVRVGPGVKAEASPTRVGRMIWLLETRSMVSKTLA